MNKTSQIIIILIVGLAAYFNSLGNGFVWDDEILIKNNTSIQNLDTAFKDAFSHSLFPADSIEQENNYYRPLQSISFAFDYFLWGNSPFGFHLTNLSLHLFNAILVYFLIYYLSGIVLLGFISALFFVAHPVNIAAVSYISGRADLLAAFFSLCSFCLYLRMRQKGKDGALNVYTIFSSIFFLCAIYSKEYTLVLPLVFLIFDYCFYGFKKANFGVYLILLFGIAVNVLMRINALGATNAFLGGKYSALLIREFPVRFFTFIKTIPLYLGIVAVPINLHMRRTFAKPVSFFDPWVWATLIIIFIGLFIFYKRRREFPIGIFLYLWFFLFIFSQSYIVIPGFSFAEHFLYLAAISIFFAVAFLFFCIISLNKNNPLRQRFIFFLLAVLVMFYASLTSIHNLNWKDNITFYKWTLKFEPKSIKVHLNLANEYFALDRFDLALAQYQLARDLLSQVSAARYQGKPDLEKKLIEAITIVHYNLGVLSAQNKDFQNAEYEYKEALKLDRNFHLARNNLAALFAKTGRSQEALKELDALLANDPNNVEAYYNLGVIYANSAKVKLARDAWQKALRLDPANEKIRKSLEVLGKK